MRYYKGLEYLIDAAKKTKFPVVIAGDGPLMQSLKHKAQGYDNIKFLGFVTSEDKMALIELCRALVFPSHLRSEAFGISLLEASMLGKPMICAEIGTGTSFININEKTGLVVPPADSDAIASAMQKLWVEDSLVEAYGKNAKSRYEDNFTSKLMAKIYVELYESLI